MSEKKQYAVVYYRGVAVPFVDWYATKPEALIAAANVARRGNPAKVVRVIARVKPAAEIEEVE